MSLEKQSRVLLLGGSGMAGRHIADRLLATGGFVVTIAGRTLKCHRVAHDLGWNDAEDGSGNSVVPLSMNALDRDSLRMALQQQNLVIVCFPYRGNLAKFVIEAAIETGCDYIDINADLEKLDELNDHQRIISDKGQTFITGAGLIPGCPLLLARVSANKLANVTSVRVLSLYRDPKLATGSALEILSELESRPKQLIDGHWQRASQFDYRRVDFGERFGERLTVQEELTELHEFAEEQKLQCLEVRQAGMNPVADSIAMGYGYFPLVIQRLLKPAATQLYQRACQWFTQKPVGVVLAVEAMDSGQNDNRRDILRLTHDSLYDATAIASVVAADEIANALRRSGVQYFGDSRSPETSLQAMQSHGINVVRSTSLP